jgi:heat shock protein HslJ
MKTRTAFFSFCLMTLLTSCTTTLKPEQIRRAQQGLLGSWTLQQATTLPQIPNNILLTLRPDAAKDEKKLGVNGFSGVNHFAGNATVKWPEQQMTFSALASTRMMGPEPRMQFELAFLKEMGAVTSFKLQDDTLELQTLSGATLFFLRGAR